MELFCIFSISISCILTNLAFAQIFDNEIAGDEVSNCATKALSDAKVVIVGAGLAGISAAAMLMENGFRDVTIFEAENRIGGRILSVPFANGIIDMGAQWIHGQTNNVVYDLASGYFQFGDTGVCSTFPTFLHSEGIPANQSQVVALTKLAEKILSSYSEQSQFSGSLGEFFITRFIAGLKAFEFDEGLSQQILDYYEKEINVWNGSSTWFDVSARGNSISKANDGNQFMTWRDMGYRTVFDFLTKKLPNPSQSIDVESQVLLNKKVSNIKLTSRRKRSHVSVSCADGSRPTADYVIFTGSLGVLKQNHLTLFTPRLPARQTKAIETLGFGNLGKIFLEFEKPFWRSDWVSYSLLWSKSDIERLRGSDKEWVIQIRSVMRVDGLPNVIEALLAGRRMEEFEKLDDDKAMADCVWLLEKFLGRQLPWPKAIRKTHWLSNQNFLGTYSFQSVEADRENVQPRDLREPLKDKFNRTLVFFAGEATDEDFPSTAHGAVASGWKAARELIDLYKKPCESELRAFI